MRRLCQLPSFVLKLTFSRLELNAAAPTEKRTNKHGIVNKSIWKTVRNERKEYIAWFIWLLIIQCNHISWVTYCFEITDMMDWHKTATTVLGSHNEIPSWKVTLSHLIACKMEIESSRIGAECQFYSLLIQYHVLQCVEYQVSKRNFVSNKCQIKYQMIHMQFWVSVSISIPN